MVTSGNFSPTLGHAIALAFLPPDVEPGADGRGRRARQAAAGDGGEDAVRRALTEARLTTERPVDLAATEVAQVGIEESAVGIELGAQAPEVVPVLVLGREVGRAPRVDLAPVRAAVVRANTASQSANSRSYGRAASSCTEIVTVARP